MSTDQAAGDSGPRFHYERELYKSGLPALTRHVLNVLLQATDKGTLIIPVKYMPSLPTLAKRTGMGQRTVERHLDLARKHGWVSWTGGKGRGDVLTYVLTLPERSSERRPSTALPDNRRSSERRPSEPERSSERREKGRQSDDHPEQRPRPLIPDLSVVAVSQSATGSRDDLTRSKILDFIGTGKEAGSPQRQRKQADLDGDTPRLIAPARAPQRAVAAAAPILHREAARAGVTLPGDWAQRVAADIIARSKIYPVWPANFVKTSLDNAVKDGTFAKYLPTKGNGR